MKIFSILLIVLAFANCTNKPIEHCTIKGQLTDTLNGTIYNYPPKKVFSREEYEAGTTEFPLVSGKIDITVKPEKLLRRFQIKAENYSNVFVVFCGDEEIVLSTDTSKKITVKGKYHEEYVKIRKLINEDYYNKLRYKREEPTEEEKEFMANFTENVLALIKEYPKSYPLCYFLDNYAPNDTSSLKKVIGGMDKSVHNSYYFIEIEKKLVTAEKRLIAAKNVEIGKIAPGFTSKDSSGSEYKLSDYKGKYILLDFWASWCRPCRIEIPNVKKLYKIYHPKGLEIISMSTDRNKEAWLKAVKDEKMPWLQLLAEGDLADNYNIEYIPMIFLLDKELKIVAKGMHGYEEIDNELKKYLK